MIDYVVIMSNAAKCRLHALPTNRELAFSARNIAPGPAYRSQFKTGRKVKYWIQIL